MIRKKTDIRSFTKQFYRKNKLAWLGAALSALLMSGINLGISWVMKELIDAIPGGRNARSMGELALFSLALVLISIVAQTLNYHAKPRFMAKAMGQYKNFVFQKLSEKSIGSFQKETTADYISALSNDALIIEQKYLEQQFDLIDQIITFVGALVMMLLFSPALTLIAIGISVLPVIASVLAGNRLELAEEKVSDRNAGFVGMLTDSLNGFSVIKSFRAEKAILELFQKSSADVEKAKSGKRKIEIVLATIGALSGAIAQFGVFFAGVGLALAGHGVTAGIVISFVQLMNYVLNPIAQVPQILANRSAARGLIGKLAEELTENVREEGSVEKTQLRTGITLENLSYAYEPDKPVLQNLSFSFEAGKRYAVVGASGSGKSTLLNLLMAAHHDYEGQICFDDVKLDQIRSESLYELVSVVQQNVFIFNASIRDNITMFSPFPKEAVDRAITLSGLSALIAERGEDYCCGENGSGLSGGEKQRISIARSLLKESQVLLVDEATAALDAQTAFQVSSAILDLEDITRIVVTHALDETLLNRYDCILTMKNGTVAEAGTFADLMERKGYFYSLFTVSQ